MTADNTGDLSIQPARAEDASALVELWSVTDLLRWWNEPEADIARMRRHSNAEVLAGWSDGRLVAAVCVGHDGHRGWFYYLAVHPSLQGLGYGRQMVRAAELWLSDQGIPKVNVMIRSSNLKAAEFYKALGYDRGSVGVVSHWLDRPPMPPDAQALPDETGRLEVIITYLEMTERPQEAPPHAPAGPRVAIMRAERPTISFYRYLYNTVGEPWLWWERRALDDAALSRVIHDDRVEVYVLYVDGVPGGFFELDRRHAEAIDLAFFGIMPEFIGRGLGPYLLGAAIDTAWFHSPPKLTVNTCNLDHPKALPLYQRFGFAPVSRETKTIDDPRITGLIPIA